MPDSDTMDALSGKLCQPQPESFAGSCPSRAVVGRTVPNLEARRDEPHARTRRLVAGKPPCCGLCYNELASLKPLSRREFYLCSSYLQFQHDI